MINYILISFISFIGGALLMNFIDTYYFKEILAAIQNDPRLLQDPEIQEKIEEILK